MKFELSQKFYFEAAHTLHRTIDAEGSRRIHGHTFHCEITLHGAPDPNTGMLTDLAFVRKEIERVREILDHRFLDEVKGLGPATLENLCAFLFKQLRETMPNLIRVSIERPASGDRCSLSC
jgi:6-pyruvoyltetrahydropterin/6-carboxytetrahydropterin synthase